MCIITSVYCLLLCLVLTFVQIVMVIKKLLVLYLFLQQNYGKKICVAIQVMSRSHIQHHHKGVLLNLDVLKKMFLPM